ncbi:MAG: hypothetical protein JJU34_09275 [Lunatimonas sp.]|uniref:hypothetical protein n=1 Tax=Lunatimonas sp. TaxID=2060141 RepID=UPI00263BD191|nr:hypothetical protein [Lunatimonas sp.]MCC5937461.1 hypothetical protein [Lunatimonas sp.]
MNHSFQTMLRYVPLCALCLLMLSCVEADERVTLPNEDDFELISRGLDGLKVNELKLVGDKLYALTNDGIYHGNVEGGNLQLLGLKGKNLTSAVVFSSTEILASLWDLDGTWDQVAELYYTSDGGDTWTTLDHNFGGEIQEPVFHFAWNPEQPDKMYATGYQVVAESTDKGVTWTPVWGDFDMFANRMRVFINPQLPNELWAGGQGAIENGYLVHLKNGQEEGFWNTLVPNPTTVKKVAFDKQTPQSIYVGWEGELSRSQNNGQSWQKLIDRHEESHFFFGIGVSTQNPEVVVAGKWAKTDEPQPLELMYSTNKGQSWTEVAFSSVQFGGILDLVLVSRPAGERIFVGLDKGGVYEIKWNR